MKSGNLIEQTLDGKYRIDRELGKGGMGTVYLATHIGTERPVAVKVIVPQFMERAEFVERFRREARAAGRLRHPNVVDVTDFGISETPQGRMAYLVMEYLDGCTLGEILEEEKQLPVSWSVDILEQVCSAVQEAHEQGIIHRDLKPDNIWLEPNLRGGYTVKVLDFGIAKLEDTQADEFQESDSGKLMRQLQSPTRPIKQNLTVQEDRQNRTIADGNGATMISESATIAQMDESSQILSEAGTQIQSSEVENEGATAILSKDENQTVSLDEHIGTKLISSQAPTDEAKLQNTTDLTRIGAVLGTPLYMSPEQCRGEKLDARSDIYSLGIIAYQMLSGKLPFVGDFKTVMDSHKDVEPPTFNAKKTPKKLKKTIMQTLAKDRDERPQTAEGFASRLRANSEGIGSLLTRALVIYSERLPKFLMLAFLISVPALLLTFVRIIFNFGRANGMIENSLVFGITAGVLSVTTFFVQVFTAAVLVGITTWIIAQILAVPLRPINMRSSFSALRLRWKPLLKMVTISTLLAMISWLVGFIAAFLGSLVITLPLFAIAGMLTAAGVGILWGLLGALGLGIGVSAIFMLVAPSIMMENLTGRAAFLRSVELVSRSFRTVCAAAILNYFVPAVLGVIIAIAVGGIVSSIDRTREPNLPAAEPTAEGEKPENNFDFQIGRSGVQVTTDNEKDKSDPAKNKAKEMRRSLSEGIFEILWSPITVLIASFTSIITALIYFKTRQAGGECMHDLLIQFEETDDSQSNWQKRVKEKLIQSGRVTSNRISSG